MFYIIIITFLILCDQMSKFFTVRKLAKFETFKLIDNVLNITYVQNTGGPWSMFNGKIYIFITLTIIIFTISVVYFKKNPPTHFLEKISICMIAGGAIGNFIDRLFRGYVVDMIELKFIEYPVFNLADCFIVIGAILMCIYVIFIYSDNTSIEVKK